jgi:hypothetical protein
MRVRVVHCTANVYSCAQCTCMEWSPNKLWIYNSITNLCYILIESIDAEKVTFQLFGHEKPTFQLKNHHLSLHTMSGPALSEASNARGHKEMSFVVYLG